MLNKKEAVYAAERAFNSVVSREIRRANVKYAAKQITRAMAEYNNVWMNSMVGSGSRYVAGVAFVSIFGD